MSIYNKVMLAFGLIFVGLLFTSMLHNIYLHILFWLLFIAIMVPFFRLKIKKHKEIGSAIEYFVKHYNKKSEKERFMEHFDEKK